MSFRRLLTSFLCSGSSYILPFRTIKISQWNLIIPGDLTFRQDLGYRIFTGLSVIFARSSILLPHIHFPVMGKKAGGGFYAVARGRNVGIFHNWDDCKAQVDGFPAARYKKFASSDEAQAFIDEHKTKPRGTSSSSVVAPARKPASKSAVSKTAFSSSTTPGGRSIKAAKTTGMAVQNPRLIYPPPVVPAAAALPKTSQKRDLSSLKVTEDRVVNKRTKMDNDVPNKKVDLESFTVDDEGYVVVFTDGACAKNGRKAAKAGIGVWFGHGHPLNISEPVEGRQTNNTAEIQAAERAIKQAKNHGINKLKLKTDSQFTINCVTKWLYSWRRNNWRLSSGGEVKNKEDLIKLDAAMQNMEIKWSYVAGHAGIEGNEAADRLAVAGAERAT